MPTYYTSDLTTDSQFKDFALNVARGFGALIHMRDEASDAPITLPEPSDYHTKELAKAQKKLAKLQKMSTGAMQKAATKAYEKDLKYYEQSIADATQRRAAYRQMIDKVNAWQPPTPDHEGLKADMLRQLTESDRFDNGRLDRPSEAPEHLTGEKWFKKSEKEAIRSIAYHTEENATEVERNAERRQWIIDLQNSL